MTVFLIGILAGGIIVAVALALVAIGRSFESERQREERHRLKSTVATYKMLLDINGIQYPEDPDEKQ